MNTPSPQPELYALIKQVTQLSRAFRRTLDEPLDTALGLNIKEATVLVAIMEGVNTPGRLAEHHSLPAPTVTRIVTKLERAGLVQRVSDATDLRRQHLELTPSGAATRARIAQVSQATAQQHFGHLPAADVKAARLALSTLMDGLGLPPAAVPVNAAPPTSPSGSQSTVKSTTKPTAQEVGL